MAVPRTNLPRSYRSTEGDELPHQPLREGAASPPTLSIILPTKNEADNIRPLLTRLERALHGTRCELIFVDDSDDETPQAIRSAQGLYPFPIRLITRPPRQQVGGLGGAVVEGLRAAHANWVCVMDADLQHPPEQVLPLLKMAAGTASDVAISSRQASSGGFARLGGLRATLSRGLIFLTQVSFPGSLRTVSDPLSGFFVLRRDAVDIEVLRPNGFKILLEILVRCPHLKVAEVPFAIHSRHAGESKAGLREGGRFLRQLLSLQMWSLRRLHRFLAVGLSGLLVNHLVLYLLTEWGELHYLLSAALATQSSTLWNFTWIEAWVFADRRQRLPLPYRLGGYTLMNNLLLVLRGPLLLVLVSALGWHYLPANLVSLTIMTLARFLVSDRWLWSKAPAGIQYEPIWYDIHGLVRVESGVPLPELEYFQTREPSGQADIRLQIKDSPAATPTDGGITYDEGLGNFGFSIQVLPGNHTEVLFSPMLRRSPHVLYTNVVEPILRWTLVRKGYALVHGACLALAGQAVLITARTDTGKTTTILNTLSKHPWGFLSDDMTILGRDGRVFSFPKPLTISLHTLQFIRAATLTRRERLALQFQSRLHSRAGRRFGMLLSRLQLPAATLNAVVQMLVPPPKYHIQRLIPGAGYVDQAGLSRVIIIERGAEVEEVIGHDAAAQELQQNSEDAYGFPPYPVIAAELSRWQGQDLHPTERAIVRQALRGLPAIRLSSDNYSWWTRFPDFLSLAPAVGQPAYSVSRAQPTRPRPAASRYVGMP